MPASVDGPYELDHIVDGDTLRIFDGSGKSQSVRLIGIDTPETRDPREPVQCFGTEATARAESLITDQVYLEADPSQAMRDRFDRLLAYVWTADGEMVNWRMVADGYAFELTYDGPYRYQADFQTAEARAEAAELGLWAPTTCDGRKTP